MLAEIAARMGHLHDAEGMLRRALELAPGFDYARLHLATALHQLNRSGEALAELDRIASEVGRYDEAVTLRAAALGRVGGYDEAIQLYHDALERTPDNVPVLMSLGYLLRTVGRLDEAVATYRRVIELTPTYGDAWWSLANLKTVEFTDEDVGAMEAALERRDLAEDDRLHLDFALGKAFEDRADFERSFRHYEAGNAIRARQLGHVPAQVTAFVERSEQVFTRELLDSRAGLGCVAPDPIFILGMPRAGSTLVEQILASHPAIEGTSELPDIIVLARGLDPQAPGERGEAWTRYPALLADLAPEELRSLGQLYLDRTRIQRRTDRPLFLDKMPNNWVHTGFIRLILPNARIIDARRHPLACGFSNFKQHYARGQEFSYDLEHFGLYYRDYVRLMRHFDGVAPGAVHRVIHERLIADPETEVRAMLDYIGLPFDEACLRFHETRRPVRSASSEQVRRPISADSAEQWRNYDRWLGPLKTGLGPALERWED
jgi:tetratricopeptide (TPR) repeat protein